MATRLSKKFSKIGAAIALLSLEMVLVTLLFLVCLLSFAYLIRKVIVLQNTGFDETVFQLVAPMVNETNNRLMLFFTFLGTHDFLIPANLLLIAYFLFIRKDKWHSIKIPAIALSSLGLMFGLKTYFGRPRPDVPLLFEANGLSFPSGHALFSITFYGLIIYLLYHNIRHTALKWIVVSIIFLTMLIIGFSRVYLRVHYASDVIAGFCVGFMWLVFTLWFLNRMERYSKLKFDRQVRQAGSRA